MDPFVIGLVAISAVLHVAWNVRLKTAGDPIRTATIGMLSASVGIVPAAVVVWAIGGRVALPPDGIALGLLSGVIEAGYFVLLAAAYRRGDLSVVYPIARGTAPLLAVAIGVGLLGERLGDRRMARGRRTPGGIPRAAAAVAGACGRPGRAGRSASPGGRHGHPLRAGDRRHDRDL